MDGAPGGNGDASRLLAPPDICSYVQLAMNSSTAADPSLHRPTLLKVVSVVERRIADLDRLGPPNFPGYACNACRDGELHRLLGILRGLAGAAKPSPSRAG